MSIEITMPALGPNVEAGNLVRWLVQEGAAVRSGEPIAEIETDKATMEVEAQGSGVLACLLVPEGTEQIKVGDVIALIAQQGDDLDALARRPAAAAAKTTATLEPTAAAATRNPRRIKASPIARRLARAQRLDLSVIQGTGPSGRIVKADVEKLAARTAPFEASATSVRSASFPAAPPESCSDAPHEIVRLSNMRKTIARRLAESKSTIPHFYLSVDIRLDALLKLRAELDASLDVKLSINDMLIKALGLALVQVPDANVRFAGDQLLKFQRADISVAVAIPGGLVTPVIRDVGRRPLAAIATEMKDLAARARGGKLAPAEYLGGCSSLSNLGMYGIKQFDAVINPPQASIIAVGAGERRAIVDGDAISVATVLSATGSFDHRAIDGAVGAELMAAFRRAIEQPLRLFG